MQLRELKNGRLAMLASAGMLYTELLSGEREVPLFLVHRLITLPYSTGNGVLEAWRIGAASPFGDGKGIF